MFLRIRPHTALELFNVALVRQVEMRPGHKTWRFQFALSHVLQEDCYSYCVIIHISHLNTVGKIILKTFIVRTFCGVGKIIWVQTEHCNWDPVHIPQTNFGKVESSTEVSGVQS